MVMSDKAKTHAFLHEASILNDCSVDSSKEGSSSIYDRDGRWRRRRGWFAHGGGAIDPLLPTDIGYGNAVSRFGGVIADLSASWGACRAGRHRDTDSLRWVVIVRVGRDRTC